LLMPAPPRRPRQDQGRTAGWEKEQTSQEMAGFRDREWTQRSSHDGICWVGWLLIASGEDDAGKPCQSQHDQGDMAVPTHVTSNLVVIQAKIFAIFKVFFNTPAPSQRSNFGRERCERRSRDQIKCQHRGWVQCPAQEQAMPAIIAALMPNGQAGPVKE